VGLVATRLDGGATYKYRVGPAGVHVYEPSNYEEYQLYYAWSPRKSYWLEWRVLRGRVELLLHRLGRNPATERGFSLAGNPAVVGFLDEAHLLLSDCTAPAAPREVRLGIATVGVSGAPQWKWHVQVPPGSVLLDLQLAPTRDRLLWVFEHRVTPPGPPAIRGLLAKIGWKPYTAISVWVSMPDGRGFRRIGVQQLGQDDSKDLSDWNVYDWPGAFAWLPSGRAVSFVWDKRIWTVPTG
jgi:hypothetical protein